MISRQTIFGGGTVVFTDINPVNDGHLLIIPKIHAETIFDISDADLAAFAATAMRVADAIPRWTGEGRGFDWKLVKRDPERIRATADRIRTHIPAEWA